MTEESGRAKDMETIQLNELLAQEVLKGSEPERPGPAYEELHAVFSVQKIKSRAHHKQALQILAKISEYLQVQKLEKDIKKQILGYMDALGVLIEEYERENINSKLEKISGSEILEFLMEQHDLKQGDLAKELGSQSIVSEILSGKRKLNSNQIQVLAERFGVSPSVFFPT